MRLTEKKSGMTLTELIVASSIMGIVLLGIVSIEMATRQTHQTSSRGSDVALRVTAAMAQIQSNAALATGYQSDPGFYIYDPDASDDLDIETICIRQDVNNPSTFSDDEWIRFKPDNVETTHVELCQNIPSGTVTDNATCFNYACPGADESYIADLKTVNYTFAPDDSSGTLEDFFLQVDITSLANNTLAYDSMKNPRYTLEARISPLAHTW